MKPTEYKIRNLGPIASLEGTFPSSGVVYAVADNGGGKSTLIRAFRDFLTAGPNENKISRGARSGEWEQTFIAANGDEYIAKFDFDPTSRERLTVITPEGTVVKKIGEIRDLLGYPDFSVEDFIRWGDSAEGRKKQANVLFKMLPEDTQMKYTNLGLDEVKFFEDRTYKGRQLKEKEGALKNAQLSDSEMQEALLYDTYTSQEEEIMSGMKGYEELNKRIGEQENSFTLLGREIEASQKERSRLLTEFNEVEFDITELEEKLKRLKAKREQLITDGKKAKENEESMGGQYTKMKRDTEEMYKEREAFASQEEKLKEVRTKMGECIEIKQRVDIFESLEEEVTVLRESHKELDDRISRIRKAKRKLIEDSELPVKDLVIEDGELFVQKGDELFKFSDSEMCTSELLVKGIEIALAANPNTKILFLFNANLLNTEKRDALDKLAKHLDYLFLLEMVDESQPSIQLIAHEEHV